MFKLYSQLIYFQFLHVFTGSQTHTAYEGGSHCR